MMCLINANHQKKEMIIHLQKQNTIEAETEPQK